MHPCRPSRAQLRVYMFDRAKFDAQKKASENEEMAAILDRMPRDAVVTILSAGATLLRQSSMLDQLTEDAAGPDPVGFQIRTSFQKPDFPPKVP